MPRMRRNNIRKGLPQPN